MNAILTAAMAVASLSQNALVAKGGLPGGSPTRGRKGEAGAGHETGAVGMARQAPAETAPGRHAAEVMHKGPYWHRDLG